MNVTMLYFAAVRDLVGRPEEELTIAQPVRTLGDLIAVLPELRPELKDKLGGVRFAINECFADPDEAVHNGDVVALIPPVAGG